MELIKIKRKPRRSNLLLIFLFILNFSCGAYIGIEMGGKQETTYLTVNLSMVYSSEKKSWINSIIDEFFFHMLTKFGIIVKMDFQPMGSRSMVISTITGEIKPTIFSPASSIWLNYTNIKLASMGKRPLIFPDAVQTTIYSPIVIGTWNLFNLNQTWNITGFKSLQKIPILRWSHTDPQLSNSGTMSVLMEVAAFLGKNVTDVEFGDLFDPEMRANMAWAESRIPYYGASTGFLAKKALDGTLDVFMVYENLIIDMNKKDLAIARGGAMAVYPEEGTLLADHPFCILAGDWVDPLEAFVAKQFLNFIKEPEIVAEAIKKGFRPIDNSILYEQKFSEIFNKTFNEDLAGVKKVIPCNIFDPNVKFEILEEIPELWTVVRAGG